MRHIPREGIVLGYLHTAGSLISLWLAVGDHLHLYRLPMLYRRINIMFVGAATTTTDALPSLCGWILCRLCFPCLADALPPLLLLLRLMLCRHCCYLLVVLDGCFAVSGACLVDAWPPSCHVVTSSQSALGDGALRVGSDAICRLVWLGELSGPLPPFCSCCFS